MMIAFGPPPFSATPVGWSLATLRRLAWHIQGKSVSDFRLVLWAAVAQAGCFLGRFWDAANGR